MARIGNIQLERTFEAVWCNLCTPCWVPFLSASEQWSMLPASLFLMTRQPRRSKQSLPFLGSPVACEWSGGINSMSPNSQSSLPEGLSWGHGGSWAPGDSSWAWSPFLRLRLSLHPGGPSPQCMSPGSTARAGWPDPEANSQYAVVQAVLWIIILKKVVCGVHLIKLSDNCLLRGEYGWLSSTGKDFGF